MGRDSTQEIDFMTKDGTWHVATKPLLEAVQSEIFAHIKAMNSAQKLHHQAIISLTPEQQESYDLTVGW